MTTDRETPRLPPALLKFYKPPVIGVIALILTLAANPIMHAAVTAMKELAGPGHALIAYQIVGAIAFIALIWGIRRNDEVSGTLIGFAAGMLLWACWASYAFKFNAISYDMPRLPISDSGATRAPHLFFIQGSIGICLATLVFFVFNKDTKCNAFRWIQRVSRIDFGRPDSGKGRNFCRITFLETVYVIWFCYAVTLFLGDERFLGYHHPVTYFAFVGSAVWGLYLCWKLFRFTRLMQAIRYAIPTKAILWLAVGELAVKYGYYDEFWLQPLDHPGHMAVIVAVFLVMMLAATIAPQRKVNQATSA